MIYDWFMLLNVHQRWSIDQGVHPSMNPDPLLWINDSMSLINRSTAHCSCVSYNQHSNILTFNSGEPKYIHLNHDTIGPFFLGLLALGLGISASLLLGRTSTFSGWDLALISALFFLSISIWASNLVKKTRKKIIFYIWYDAFSEMQH